MLALIAQGQRPAQRCKILLNTGDEVLIGRSPDADLPILWDPSVSRRHVRLKCLSDEVEIERIPGAQNPVFVDGQAVDALRIPTGGRFVLGLTSVLISQTDVESPWPSNQPIEQFTFDRRELQNVPYLDAHKRIDVLAQLPELIRGARIDEELYHRLVNLLLAGVASAEAVAIVNVKPDEQVEVLHWARRLETAGAFHASSRLVRQAITISKRTVLHVWEKHPVTGNDYTQSAEFDWAFCSPVTQNSHGEWGIYVAGRLDGSPTQHGDRQAPPLHADVKFTEFVSEIITTVQRENRWERQKAALQQFLPPPILDALGDDLNTDLLEPRECDITVLFCDLRGFSRKAEASADDLLGLLDRVSSALELMTREILRFGGVTGDFQGDAALGFWGWPFASEEAPLNACRAALEIREAFRAVEAQPDHPLANFRMGIGIAHGRAVAGKIGTSGQVKATVFGPVVNLASRLEGMTKELRAPILLDQSTADLIRQRLPATEGRVRRLARVQPFGMDTPVDISELLPPSGAPGELTDEQITTFEKGVEDFIAGRWEPAYQSFHSMPASDRAQDFLSVLIAQHNRIAPPGWDGVVRLTGK